MPGAAADRLPTSDPSRRRSRRAATAGALHGTLPRDTVPQDTAARHAAAGHWAMLSARELYDRAVDLGNAGRHAVAAATLERAARRTDDPDLTARIAGTAAYLEAETGDPDAALARCRAALAAPGLSTHTRAVLVSQLGLIELRRGDLDAALAHLGDSTGGLARDPGRLGRVVLNRGLVHLERGDVPRAEHDFAAAVDQFAASGEEVEQAKARHNQGYAALLRGDLVAALRLMDGARDVLASLSPVALAVCDLDRAEVLRAAGETAEAVRLLTAAARAFGARRLRQMQADAELTLASTLLATEPGAAGAVAGRAARRLRARGNETGALRAEAVALTAAVLAGAAGPALRDRLTDVADRLAGRGLDAPARELRLLRARVDVRAGRLGDAATGLGRVRVPDRAPVTTRLLDHEVRAELARARGRPGRVLEHAGAGLDELQEWQATFGSLDLRSSAAVHGRTLALLGLRTAVADGDAARVLEWSERTRSLAGRVLPLRPPPDPRTADDLTELRRLRMADDDGSAATASREEELRAAVRRRGWAGAGSGALRALPTLDGVRAALAADDAALLAVLWSGDRLTALVVADRASVVDLGPWQPVATLLDGLLGDLDMAGADLPEPMAAVVRASLDGRLAGLDEHLLGPVRGLLTTRRVVVTAPGVLSGVPWGMLPSLVDVALTLPVSAGRWLEQRRSGPGGDHRPRARAGFVVGPGVARGDEEVRAAAAGWSAPVVLRGDAATTDGVARLAGAVDLLHVAAHGRHSAQHPLFSGLELGDGPWFGFDIDQLEHVPDVVVLSACEVGRSAAGWGRESLGMAQAWLHAGARCVLAASAAVNDRAASELLATVHRGLAAGEPPSDALVTAQRSTGRRTPFTVHGAGW